MTDRPPLWTCCPVKRAQSVLTEYASIIHWVDRFDTILLTYREVFPDHDQGRMNHAGTRVSGHVITQ